jgi:CheY-specific phosphatase CheX
MSSENRAPVLQREVLMQTLQSCVDEVFAMMVCSFKEAAMKSVEVVQPREETKIRFRDEAETEAVDVHKQVSIGFSGDARGQVVLRCSVDSADSIARGLLMMDESEVLELAAVTDALGECANMLAGSLKTKALDPVGSFQLGLPDFSDPRPNGAMEGALVYKVAQGVMSVEVWLE